MSDIDMNNLVRNEILEDEVWFSELTKKVPKPNKYANANLGSMKSPVLEEYNRLRFSNF